MQNEDDLWLIISPKKLSVRFLFVHLPVYFLIFYFCSLRRIYFDSNLLLILLVYYFIVCFNVQNCLLCLLTVVHFFHKLSFFHFVSYIHWSVSSLLRFHLSFCSVLSFASVFIFRLFVQLFRSSFILFDHLHKRLYFSSLVYLFVRSFDSWPCRRGRPMKMQKGSSVFDKTLNRWLGRHC